MEEDEKKTFQSKAVYVGAFGPCQQLIILSVEITLAKMAKVRRHFVQQKDNVIAVWYKNTKTQISCIYLFIYFFG